MVNHMPKEHIIEQLPDYALGILSAEENRHIERHVDTCALCQRELTTFEAIAGELAFAVPAVEPSTGLEARLMDAAARTPQQSATPGRSWWETLKALFAHPVPAWSLGAVAVTLIAILFAVWSSQPSAPTIPDGIQTIAMVGTTAAPEASGLLVIDPTSNKGTLIVEDLPALDSEHQYQLWVIRDGTRISGAIFSVDETGYSTIEVTSPRPLSEYSAFGITIEPFGGSPGPTGDKVLGGSL